MRTVGKGMLVLLICLMLIPNNTAYAAQLPKVTADAAILMDWKTGIVLYEKKAHSLRHPASLTKMLTAIVALENGSLQDVVRVSPEAANTRGSRAGLRGGQQFTLEDLLYMVLLESANDAAIAIAVHVGGSISGFSEMMNKKARDIGALNTEFFNPHGLTEPGHLTTAYDQALIARYAMSCAFIAEAVATREADVDRLDKDIIMRLHNTNRLLASFSGADGVKTGTTTAAGKSLAASATRGDHRLICIVLHSDSRWQDAANLLDYGFSAFKLVNPYNKGDIVKTTRVMHGMQKRVALHATEDLAVVLPTDAAGRVTLSLIPDRIDAPCKRGTAVGQLDLLLDGKPVASTRLAPIQDVLRYSLLKTIYQNILEPLGSWLMRKE